MAFSTIPQLFLHIEREHGARPVQYIKQPDAGFASRRNSKLKDEVHACAASLSDV